MPPDFFNLRPKYQTIRHLSVLLKVCFLTVVTEVRLPGVPKVQKAAGADP